MAKMSASVQKTVRFPTYCEVFAQNDVRQLTIGVGIKQKTPTISYLKPSLNLSVSSVSEILSSYPFNYTQFELEN